MEEPVKLKNSESSAIRAIILILALLGLCTALAAVFGHLYIKLKKLVSEFNREKLQDEDTSGDKQDAQEENEGCQVSFDD